MASINKVMLLGNLGADPELRYTSGGTAVADLRLATNRRFKGRDGEWQDDTQWHRIVVWAKQAENCKEYLSKGSQCFVEGRLQTRQWEDRDGNKRYTTEVVSRRVVFLGGRTGEGGPPEMAAPPPPPAQGGPPEMSPPPPPAQAAARDDDIPF